MQFCFSLYLFLEHVAALVTGHADSAATLRCLLNLLAARTFEISVVLSVTAQLVHTVSAGHELCYFIS